MKAETTKHENLRDGRVRVTAYAFGDTLESVVPVHLTPCKAWVRRNPETQAVFMVLEDNRGQLVTAARIFTADEFLKAG